MTIVNCFYSTHFPIVLFHPLNFLYIRPSHTRTTTQHSIAYIIFAASFSSFLFVLRCHSPRRVLKAAVHGTHQCELSTILYYVLFYYMLCIIQSLLSLLLFVISLIPLTDFEASEYIVLITFIL